MYLATSNNKSDLISLGTAVDSAMGFPTKDGLTIKYSEILQNTVNNLYGYCVDDSQAYNLAQTAGLNIINVDDITCINWVILAS